MRVRAVDGTEPQGAALVLAVLRHAEKAPDGPWAASPRMSAVTDATGTVWFVEGDQVSRLVPLSCRCACAEVTTYSGGVEISRIVGPAR